MNAMERPMIAAVPTRRSTVCWVEARTMLLDVVRGDYCRWLAAHV
jgi:hypothetical protein